MTKAVASGAGSPARVVSGVEGAPQAELRLRHEERLERFGTGAGLSQDGTGLGEHAAQDQSAHQGDGGRAKRFRDRMDAALRKSTAARPSMGNAGQDGADDALQAVDPAASFGLPASPRMVMPGTATTGHEAILRGYETGAGPSSDPGDAAQPVDAASGAGRVVLQAEPRRFRILATSEPPADRLQSLFEATRPAVPSGAEPTALEHDTAARVETVAARVEEAIRAELSAGATGPIEIRIPVDASLDGLASLSVVVSDRAIDVVIARAAGEASEGLVQAAQVLAERLQRRTGKSSIRVLDVVAAGSETERPSADAADPLRARRIL